ncbi:transposase [Aequorivita sublithincola DSM 14238]|uniref:Transposase n=1 Tax=Aequorivita sublithincola (strain DSM 14238 / LMG 21431 / ACAM 643 / 9-3) TaxID=746697 RepID=I3YUS5_AEQSU|nr:transposase [Aequorivita sublithincola]AFL80743.1 transposase [Aequorivita sublithincola DSM 14238]
MKHKDGSFRLKNWDYSSMGLYFLTICTKDKEHFFGSIENEKMILNEIGEIFKMNWMEIEKQFPNIETADFVIMPNHLHCILIIDGIVPVKIIGDEGRAINRAATDVDLNSVIYQKTGGITGNKNLMLHQNVSTAVRWFKGKTTFDSRKVDSKFGWQPRFYDHIIRNQRSLIKIQDYIHNNPKMWNRDRNNEEGLKM